MGSGRGGAAGTGGPASWGHRQLGERRSANLRAASMRELADAATAPPPAQIAWTLVSTGIEELLMYPAPTEVPNGWTKPTSVIPSK